MHTLMYDAQEVNKWRQEIGPVGIHDVEKHLRSDAYMVTLEYPGCEARAHPPIIFFNGMVRGTKEEMIKQVSATLDVSHRHPSHLFIR